MRIIGCIVILLTLASQCESAVTIDFEELADFNGTPPAGTGEYFNGYGFGANSDGFSSQGALFQTGEFGPGWSYSNVNNSVTPGFTNQFAVFAGGGSNGAGGVLAGSNYGLVNTGSETTMDGTPLNGAFVNLPQLAMLDSIEVTNTTYAQKYIVDGEDGFGSPDFDVLAQFTDGDFFRLTISGFDGLNGTGTQTGSTTIDLANYGGAGNADDFFLDNWQEFDLSGFGLSRSLVFSTTSSQISDFTGFGLGYAHDVPAYAAIDNLRFSAVPEPSSLGLSFLATGLLVGRWRQRSLAG